MTQGTVLEGHSTGKVENYRSREARVETHKIRKVYKKVFIELVTLHSKMKSCWTGEMTQQVKMLATKPGGIILVEKEPTPARCQTCTTTEPYPRTHTK